MSDKLTQCKQIVEYIREKGHITSLEAYQKLKVTQLAARITDLESAGFVFAKVSAQSHLKAMCLNLLKAANRLSVPVAA